MTFQLRSVPNKEVLIPGITEDNFAYLKAIPEEAVEAEAKLNARVRNFFSLKALLQETGVPNFLAEKDFNDFDVDDQAFVQWVKDNKIIFPYTQVYHPSTGKIRYLIRLINDEVIADLYAEKLSDLYIKAYLFNHTLKVSSNKQAEVVFIDRWLVVQDYENYEAMQNALNAFQSKVAEQADRYVEAQQQMQQEASESVLEGSSDIFDGVMETKEETDVEKAPFDEKLTQSDTWDVEEEQEESKE